MTANSHSMNGADAPFQINSLETFTLDISRQLPDELPPQICEPISHLINGFGLVMYIQQEYGPSKSLD